MNNFVVCNFLENNLNGIAKKGIKTVRFSENIVGAQEAKCFINLKRAEMAFYSMDEKEEEGFAPFDFVSDLSESAGLTKDQLGDTEENPLILVATDLVNFLEGVPTYVKYFPVKEGVLIMLVKGYIEVNMDGEMVPLSRCISEIPSVCKYHTLGVTDFSNMNLLVDKESDVAYNGMCVSDCIIDFHVAKKDNGVSRKVNFDKSCFSIFCEDPFIEGKKVKEEKKKRMEEERKAKALENSKFMEYYRKKQEAMEYARSSGTTKDSATRSKKRSSKGSVKVGSEGASRFLQAVEALK